MDKCIEDKFIKDLHTVMLPLALDVNEKLGLGKSEKYHYLLLLFLDPSLGIHLFFYFLFMGNWKGTLAEHLNSPQISLVVKELVGTAW